MNPTGIARVGLAIAALLVAFAIGWWLVPPREVYKFDRVAEIQLDLVANALRSYAHAHGRYPTTEQGLSELVSAGEFKRDALLDPWGKPLVYRCLDPDCSRVEVRSMGSSAEDAHRVELSRIVE